MSPVFIFHYSTILQCRVSTVTVVISAVLLLLFAVSLKQETGNWVIVVLLGQVWYGFGCENFGMSC
jgi:uncharacterized membrane protein YqhA